MGYFPNGTSAEIYQSTYCAHCRNADPEHLGCAVWDAHMIHNYAECTNDDSILHMLIPRDGIENKVCAMFLAWDEDRCPDTPDMFKEAV